LQREKKECDFWNYIGILSIRKEKNPLVSREKRIFFLVQKKTLVEGKMSISFIISNNRIRHFRFNCLPGPSLPSSSVLALL
jgi:hypothetical protein